MEYKHRRPRYRGEPGEETRPVETPEETSGEEMPQSSAYDSQEEKSSMAAVVWALLGIMVLALGLLFVVQNWNNWFGKKTTLDTPKPTVAFLSQAKKLNEVPTEEPTPTMTPQVIVTEKIVEVMVYVTPEPTAPPEKQNPTEPPVRTMPTEEEDVSILDLMEQPEGEEPLAEIIPLDETVSFTFKGEQMQFETFAYSGGWRLPSDPWYVAIFQELTKEVLEAFGMPISGEMMAELTQNWLKAAVSDGWTLTWLRFQMDLEDFADMAEVNNYVEELKLWSDEEYDELANDTLQYFFAKLNGGEIKDSTYWSLEVMLRAIDEQRNPELFARRYNDTNHTPDQLVTFFDKDDNNFVSSNKALIVACRDAKVDRSDYLQTAWVNLFEGGTWKWKPRQKASVESKAPETESPPSPTEEPPTNPPPPPTDPPTNPPTEPPKKDPEERPKISDVPVGGGGTNPTNSEEPHTDTHAESTPAKVDPVTPEPTPAPTPVPTAVREHEPEDCGDGSPPLVEEDLGGGQPDGYNGTQNVAGQDVQTQNDADAGDLDTDSV